MVYTSNLKRTGKVTMLYDKCRMYLPDHYVGHCADHYEMDILNLNSLINIIAYYFSINYKHGD